MEDDRSFHLPWLGPYGEPRLEKIEVAFRSTSLIDIFPLMALGSCQSEWNQNPKKLPTPIIEKCWPFVSSLAADVVANLTPRWLDGEVVDQEHQLPLHISDAHEIPFVQLFILSSNNLDYNYNLSCQLVGSPSDFSACFCRRGYPPRYPLNLPSISGNSSLLGTTNAGICPMIPMKPWEKVTNTNRNRFLPKVNSVRIHEQEFGPQNSKTVKSCSTKIWGQEIGFARTLYSECLHWKYSIMIMHFVD